MKRSKKFAFGTNKFGPKNIACPSVAAYYTTNDKMEYPLLYGPVSYYDTELIEQTHKDDGTVSEKQARRAWFKAILKAIDPTTGANEIKRLRYAKEGLEVAEKLGWLK